MVQHSRARSKALEPGLAVRALRPLVSGLRVLGHDPAAIFAAAGLDAAAVGDPEARVPTSTVMALWEGAVQRTADPELGLHIAEHAELEAFDVTLYAMLSSPTLGQAYERMRRYQRLIHETTRITLEIQNDRATLRHSLPGGLAVPRQAAEFLLATWLRVGRLVVGMDWAPHEVRFAHAEPRVSLEHARLFGCPVRFCTGENTLVVPASLLERPSLRADQGLLAILDRHASELLARAPDSIRLADRARSILIGELCGGDPSASRVAAGLKMSVRTLQRGLSAEGIQFGALVDQLRHELAIRHLAEQRLALAELAFLLGFSELSSFHRAFKRWTHTTPADFRASLRLGQ